MELIEEIGNENICFDSDAFNIVRAQVFGENITIGMGWTGMPESRASMGHGKYNPDTDTIDLDFTEVFPDYTGGGHLTLTRQ